MSDTPKTDAAYSIYDLRKVAQDIERELNAANERIKRLEEENDALRADLLLWNEKEVK